MSNGDAAADLWVIGVGGNALADPHNPQDLAHQEERAAGVAAAIAEAIAAGVRVLIVHGNGPQVGARLIQNEAARREVPPSALEVCVAETQGQVGHFLSMALRRELDRRALSVPIAVLLTHVLVDAAAPEFQRPDKPVGPVYTREEAAGLAQRHDWRFAPLPDRGWRRVVPSPRPLQVIEASSVDLLLREGACVIAGGGGGVPVVADPRGVRGIEAVVDKDYTAELLAAGAGARRLVILTDVPGVALSYGAAGQRFLAALTVDEARVHSERGEFAPGSMGPKVEACLEFLAHGGREATIAATADARSALRGRAGTRLTP